MKTLECPLYHSRFPNTYPEAVGRSSNYRSKINIWGGISNVGPTNFLVRIKETPDYSADLNPIEDLWDDMKDFIRKKICTNDEELNNSFREYVRTLTPEKCRSFIRKLKKVIKLC